MLPEKEVSFTAAIDTSLDAQSMDLTVFDYFCQWLLSAGRKRAVVFDFRCAVA
jgi:hypothetical protein